MPAIRIGSRALVFLAMLVSWNMGVSSQITVKKPAKPLIVRPTTSNPSRFVLYDLRASLEVAQSDNDRSRLTATVKNISSYGYAGGGSLVFSRAGHGEPLPARYGDRVDRTIKWGHKRLASRILPGIKAGESVTYSVEVNGRADFYAHLEGLNRDTNSANNRGDASNLKEVSYTIDSDIVNEWFFPHSGPQTAARSRLHGHRGDIEIPGLIPATTFALPNFVWDAYRTGLRVKIAIKAHDINLRKARVFLSDKFAYRASNLINDSNSWLYTEVTWELDGVEFKMGDDMLVKALYPDMHYLEHIPSYYNPFAFRIGFRLRFDARAQLFRLEEHESEIRSFFGGISIDGKTVTDRYGPNEMFAPTAPQIRANMAAAIAKKKSEIEWLFNKRMRKVLTDSYGNPGAIDSVTFDGWNFVCKLRVPIIPATPTRVVRTPY